MNILIAGGSGFIGSCLYKYFSNMGYSVKILTRETKRTSESVNNYITWKQFENDNIKELDVIINLSGESIGKGRWTTKRKESILKSRINSTSILVKAINEKRVNPKIFINASAIGYYGNRGNEELNENSIPGSDFLSQVCILWEQEAFKAKTRVLSLRTGLVLGNNEAFHKLIFPYKFNIGGSLGSGKQWVSWVHIEDFALAVNHIIENNDIRGSVNITSPNPLKMKDFQRSIGKALKKPSWLSVPSFALRMLMGEMAAIVLNSQKVIPEKLIASGFKFKYPEAIDAISSLIKKKN